MTTGPQKPPGQVAEKTADGTTTAGRTGADRTGAEKTAAGTTVLQPAPAPPRDPQAGHLNGPWPAVSRWRREWPGPGAPASVPTVLALSAAAVVAALSLPLDRGGVGWLITAVAGVAALTVARVVTVAEGVAPLVRRPVDLGTKDRFGWAAATVALLAVGTFRAADWLFVLCALTATLTGALALSSGRSLRAVLTTYALLPSAGSRSLPWLSRGFARLRSSGGGSPIRVLATAAVSLALLTVFSALFASADAAFARFFEAAIPDLRAVTILRWVFVAGLALLVLGAAAYLRAAPPDLSSLDRTAGPKVSRLEWAIPLGLLVLLFAAFVTIQLAVLFGGARHVVETDGLTYAEYARGGFWQLCAVTGLTLVVLAGVARWAPRQSRTDRIVLRAVLGALAVLTLVIVASALHRMTVYTGTYGLTRMRLLVACCEVWFGIVLVLVLVAGLRIRAPWLPRVAIAAGVLALLGLATANPDALIAENHVNRFEKTQRIDMPFLGTLSPDAVPDLAEISDPQTRLCLLWSIMDSRPATGDWRSWSLGRQTARDVVSGQRPADPQKCWDLIYSY